jgi:SSS family solute:Na+ symporter
MILAGILVINMLPNNISFLDAVNVAGKMGKLNLVNFDFDLDDRYNFWTGTTAALFLFLSYFGTDQSQVQRYLTGKSLAQSRLGLIMNGLLKIPMQLIILFIGVMVFVFYQFNTPPIFFNKVELNNIKSSNYSEEVNNLENEFKILHDKKTVDIYSLLDAQKNEDKGRVQELKRSVLSIESKMHEINNNVKTIVIKNNPSAETNDKDYIFMSYVIDYLPRGIIGLLFAVMFCAAMSSTASELNALASTTTIDIYKRSIKKKENDLHYLMSSKYFTLLWGVLAILFATTASLFENLIQAVNLLGSLFYGTILGIFVVAFYFKNVKSNAVFYCAIAAEIMVVSIHFLNHYQRAPNWLQMGYLWYNVVGCLLVILFATLTQKIINLKKAT